MNTPAMVAGTTEMVSVEWIMQHSTWSVDHFNDDDGQGVNYLAMAQEKAGDEQFGPLVTRIMEKGFKVPIVLCLNFKPYYMDSAKNVVHGNGHHRFVAALLLMLDEIPVYWNDYAADNDYMCTHTSEAGRIGRNHKNLVKGFWEEYSSPWD